MGIPSTYEPGFARWFIRAKDGVDLSLAYLGQFLTFLWQTVRYIPVTPFRYPRQTIRTITDLTWGRGAVVIGGGTALLMAGLGIAAGATVAIIADSTLDLVGLGSVTGSVSSFAITREFAPILAAVAFTIQAGCRMTAEIGSMRISEEIDALEVIGVHSMSFVVSTRVIAGVLTTIPTFLVALVASYLSSAFVVVSRGGSRGAYAHYFDQFVNFPDMLAATVKTITFIVAITLIHCYKGFFAAGGPEGVGVASGRAVRASLVAIMVLDLALTLAFWGVNSPFLFRG
ncbi:MlaE family ABC transporter permease [Gordonia liuliyuniae]|uniref:ABC transporter permease n=1 Tax=Gordonia liuliyuniae TaxID=2911517 RepID=A0ABS9IN95_9ACTN|nr:ABC transporter permease [Gordonia liuliyuniae]MCF8587028.1 ABC transporter permease [Gordonia liuliyuniae]